MSPSEAPNSKKNHERAQFFFVKSSKNWIKRAPQTRVNCGFRHHTCAICCQKCIILEQSDWSQAGCLNTANLATSQAELASEDSFRLSFLIYSYEQPTIECVQNLYCKISWFSNLYFMQLFSVDVTIYKK